MKIWHCAQLIVSTPKKFLVFYVLFYHIITGWRPNLTRVTVIIMVRFIYIAASLAANTPTLLITGVEAETTIL